VNPRKILFIFGTRPEAIKLCPVIRWMARHPAEFEVRVCVTAQHRDMLDQVLSIFEVEPHRDLDVMRPGQSLYQSTSRILAGLKPVLAAKRPDMVVVQGDTTTTLCGGLAAFYARVPLGHVEAGLRTWDLAQPFPEEMNRVVVTKLAALHFAATEGAARNLRRDGVAAEGIVVTGNSGIDAVLQLRDRLEAGTLRSGHDWSMLSPVKKLIVVTAHRRESFGEGFERICQALAELAARPDVELVYPVHPNPNVTAPVRRLLAGLPNVYLVEPLDYVSFVDLMRRAYILVTDSGGVQEEGPSLGKPILVMREKTERPEAVEAGTVRLVGSDVRRIVGEATRLLDDAAEYDRRAHIHNPYGDGHASERIVEAIVGFGEGWR
jgi:UDP-N-acetylglucosamine 2-epimerase (non-hydrolysing)